MFSGRNYELQYLNNYYERDGSQIMVLYGEKKDTSEFSEDPMSVELLLFLDFQLSFFKS